jgi:3-hydroxyisobutyrate dehydrogenase
MMRIGFIGTGVMGGSMAGHLLEAGHSLVVHNRTKSKAENLIASGAVWSDTVAGVAERAEVLFTIIGDPSDVEATYLGPDGILSNATPCTIAVDMTTSSPELAIRISEEGQHRDIAILDAPVSGGDRGAREGTLSIMVGGSRVVFEKIRPLFDLMGKNVVYQGEAGSGQKTKMANQIAAAGGMLGVCEALTYAETSGLDAQTVLKSIESGAAGSWALSNLGPRILEGDFDPGFFVKHFIKDLKIAVASAQQNGTDLPALDLTLKRYEELAAWRGDEEGTQALYRLYQKKD